MLNFGEKFDAFIAKAPAAVALRATLQRLLPAQQLDKLFNDTAEKQYEKTLLFSTLMTLMLDVTLKSTASLHKSYLYCPIYSLLLYLLGGSMFCA